MKFRWIVVVGLVSVTVALATAQGPRRDLGDNARVEPDQVNVLRADQFGLSIDVNLVNLDVVVTTRNNDPIAGLVRSQFRLFVDDIEQPITNFRPTEAPLTVVLLIEFGQTVVYYYDDVIRPAWGFIQSLREDDWAALVSFDVSPEILTDFTRNSDELLFGLQQLQFATFRETALYDALDFTLDRLENVDGKKAIFLLSSGIDTISRMSYGEVLDRVEASNTMIYAVGMGQLYRILTENSIGALGRIELIQADNALRQITEASGGSAFFPRFQTEYPSIYDTISAHLRYQYSLGFIPTGLEDDGNLKEFRIEVGPLDVDGDGDVDDLRVRHKRGFYMSPPD